MVYVMQFRYSVRAFYSYLYLFIIFILYFKYTLKVRHYRAEAYGIWKSIQLI